jgi:anaerobic ribonucleoside-triphosphate reductase activating protein
MTAGRHFTEAEMRKLISLLEKPYIKGLTLSGGDPLFEGNREAVEQIVKNLKLLCPTKDIWLYTGYEYEEVKDLDILNYVDVLVDGKFVQEQRDITLAFRGSKNQKIIELRSKDDSKGK